MAYESYSVQRNAFKGSPKALFIGVIDECRAALKSRDVRFIAQVSPGIYARVLTVTRFIYLQTQPPYKSRQP